MSWTYKLAQALLLLIAAFGTMAGFRLSHEHLTVAEICPTLGPVAACVIVFAGYLLVLIATIFVKKTWALKLFYIGWSPVFLLALAGVVFELTRGEICPPGPAGIPQCFISLAMASVAWILFFVIRKSAGSAQIRD